MIPRREESVRLDRPAASDLLDSLAPSEAKDDLDDLSLPAHRLVCVPLSDRHDQPSGALQTVGAYGD